MPFIGIALAAIRFLTGFVQRRTDLNIEEIHADVTNRQTAASVVIAGMGHKMFWLAWSIAAIPLTLWFGWGVADTMLWNGTVLPDVGTLTPQLKQYADVVWGNIFYVGGGVAATQIIGGVISRAITGRR